MAALTTRSLSGRLTDFNGVQVYDVADLFTDHAERRQRNEDLFGILIHHDGISYNGDTLRKDVERLNAIYNHAIGQGWKRFPYHKVASPTGALYLTLPPQLQGSHIAHRNHRFRGLALMGDLWTNPGPPTKLLCAAAAGIVLEYQSIGRLISIGGHSDFVEPPHTHGSPPIQHGHETSCPGDFRAWSRNLWPLVSYHAQRLLDTQRQT